MRANERMAYSSHSTHRGLNSAAQIDLFFDFPLQRRSTGEPQRRFGGIPQRRRGDQAHHGRRPRTHRWNDRQVRS